MFNLSKLVLLKDKMYIIINFIYYNLFNMCCEDFLDFFFISFFCCIFKLCY